MYRLLELWTICSLLETTAAVTNRGSIFLQEHGMLLREHGLLHMDTSNVYLSVFVNHAIPTFELDNPTACANGLVRNFMNADKDIKAKAASLVERHNQLLNINNGQSRSKRNIAAVLGAGLGIFNLLFTGVAEYKLSKHIRKVENQFIEFKRRQQYVNEKFVKVLENTVSLVDHELTQMIVNINNLECGIAKIMQQQAYKELINNWSDKMDQLYFHINRGSLSGPLNSFILDPGDLKKVLDDHPELQQTLFAQNIMLFYQTATVTYLESEISSDQRFINLHLVLQIPLLYDSECYRLYKVEKVPLVINNTCITIDIPQFVYSDRDNALNLMELDDRACTISNLISTCDDMYPQNKTISDCLMNNNCTLKEAVCRPRQFIYHYTGVLVSGHGGLELKFIKKNPKHHENKIITREFNKFGLAWVSWDEAEYIQYDGLRLSSPTHTTNLVTVKYPRNQSSDWWNLLTNTSITIKDLNKKKQIDDDLEDLKHVIYSNKQHEGQLGFVNIVLLMNSVFIVLIIGILIIMHCSCRQHLTKCITRLTTRAPFEMLPQLGEPPNDDTNDVTNSNDAANEPRNELELKSVAKPATPRVIAI